MIEQNRVIAEASNACPVVFLGAFGRYLWAQPANVRPVEKKIAGYAMIVCPWERIDMVITDSGLTEGKRKRIKDLGIQLIVVPV